MLITEKNKKLNISFDNKSDVTDVSLFKDIYGTHAKIGSKVYGDYPTVTKVTDYLYEITVDDTDEEYAKELLHRLC